MSLKSLLYVSRCRLDAENARGKVDDIVHVAASRNASLSVTGALVFTEVHFAQVLEGPPEAVDELMSSILRDSRHQDVQVLRSTHVPSRRFSQWSMAYAGPSRYVSGLIRPLTEQRSHEDLLIERLLTMMEEFAEIAT